MGRAPLKPMKESWIQTWLREWAQWESSRSGYASETTISRAMAGKLNWGSFGPQLPKDVEPYVYWMKRLNIAMANLEAQPSKVKYIKAIRMIYLIGWAEASERLGKHPVTVWRWRKTGEKMIQQAIEADMGKNEVA